jgi:hydroxyacyl-ACP dehydratase HTD2-like protein with hotdog domain
MPTWLVKATWTEDETEASEQWEVNAGTAQDALREVTPHLHFVPHHVEIKLTGSRPHDAPASRVRRVSTR